MITVIDLLKQKGKRVWSLEAGSSIREALQLLTDKDVGALVVTKKGKLCGIFSERDFARKLAEENTLSLDTPISKLMTANVLTVSPQDTIEDCMKLMTEHHIRHLPVIKDEEMIGLISIGDVVKSIISGQKSLIRQLEDYISGRW